MQSLNLQLEHVPCDLCGHQEYTVRYRKPDTWLWPNQFEYPVVECRKCGLVYVNPRPTQDSMRLFYPAGYHDDRDHPHHEARYIAQAKYLPKLANERVLDIGCARGDFLTYLKKTYPGIRAFGCDFFSEKVTSPEISFQKALLPNCGYPAESFDLVTAWAVFEHLHSPSQYFAEVHRVLRVGGRFVFLVTNSESLYGRRAYAEDIPRHTYHFSENSLAGYANIFGFEIAGIHYDDVIFDGRGTGTFYQLFSTVGGDNWQQRYFKKRNVVSKVLGLVGRIIDKTVFAWHWEAKLRRSGIIVVEFIKR